MAQEEGVRVVIKNLFKNIIELPFSIAADIITLGGQMTKESSYTIDTIKELRNNWGKL